MEDRGGMDGWTPSELSPGRLDAAELVVASLYNIQTVTHAKRLFTIYTLYIPVP